VSEALVVLDEKEEVVLVGVDALIAQREGDLLRVTEQEVLECRRCAVDVFDTPRLSVGSE
jgi:hypothetical protein